MRNFLYKLIIFYQKFISVLSPPSCRYIPTCSQYAKLHIRHTNLFKAIYLIILRVLKCNQLFKGGYDYPIIDYKPHNIVYKKIKVTLWFVPIKNSKNKYYIVQAWKNK